ncbi:MAG TPA: hypothetical protein VHJ69_12035 [Gemmatimonadales bacterium]|jgi:hypothetical protein|nr:hypothetical protein [Gemmatimonadales bacterium]
MADYQDENDLTSERDLLVRCIEVAHEALRLIPDVDENGPALVWFAEHLLQAHQRARQEARAA